VMRDQAHDYRDVGPHVEGMSSLGGRWRVEQESARAEAPGAAISLRYTAKDVNLVMAPPAGAVVRMEIVLDGSQRAGEDVKFEGERGFVTVDSPRMYSLVANDSVVSGATTLRAEQAGVSVYAFTFISCTVT
jgi:Thioredoxin like C-terminal domain